MAGDAKRKKIAVSIQSEVQFFSVAPLLEELRREPYDVSILIDDYIEDESGYAEMGYSEMAKKTIDLIKEYGFAPQRLTSKKKNMLFDLCLMPYEDKTIKAKRYIKYEYGTLNIKPNLTYVPALLEGFHGFLCQSKITYEMLKAYGATFPVENLRFCNRVSKRESRNGKKILLFAPTYNDLDELAELEKLISLLKKDYYVVIKGHHGTNYLKKNSEKKKAFELLADEYYDSRKNLSDLIIEADVCLFGNSSAIGEALYAKVPCAIFTKDLDYFKLDEIHTTQYKIVKGGFVPWTDKVEDILDIIKQALSADYRKKQNKLSDEIFPQSYRTGSEGYLKVIKYFLHDPIAEDYVMLHDYILKENYKSKKEEIDKLASRNKELVDKIEGLEECVRRMTNKIEDDKKKKLYRIADKIYKIEGRILNGKG